MKIYSNSMTHNKRSNDAGRTLEYSAQRAPIKKYHNLGLGQLIPRMADFSRANLV